MHAMTPAYAFTIPSLADGIPLDCRIYHPRILQDEYFTPFPQGKSWLRKAAVVAHPYAPLGGCMDDPIVMTVVEKLLDLDFVVGTFNFRGATGSKGSSSWTGRGEREDYMSFTAFLIHYLSQLQLPFPNERTATTPDGSPRDLDLDQKTITHPPPTEYDDITLILGGYSYGSLIVTQLPTTESILQRLKNPIYTVTATEILLRSRTLAAETNHRMEDYSHRRHHHQRGSSQDFFTATATSSAAENSHSAPSALNTRQSIIFGGQETPTSPGGESRRQSTDLPHRIKDRVIHHHRRGSSLSRSRSTRKSSHLNPLEDSQTLHQSTSNTVASDLVTTSYLLISPLLPPLSTVLSPSVSFSFSSLTSLIPFYKSARDDHHHHRSNNHQATTAEIFIGNKTCVVFGSEDGFTSARRMRAWCRKMEGLSLASDTAAAAAAAADSVGSERGREGKGRGFTWREQEGVGHFWREKGGIEGLKGALEGWVKATLNDAEEVEMEEGQRV